MFSVFCIHVLSDFYTNPGVAMRLLSIHRRRIVWRQLTHCNTLQHTATQCNTMQHTATHCIHRRRTALRQMTHCNTLQYSATHCNTLQRTASIDAA